MIDVEKEIKALDLHLSVLSIMIGDERAREWHEKSFFNLMNTEEGKKYLEKDHG